MLYKIGRETTIQAAAKAFGYTDYKEFFKTMRYVKGHTFQQGNVIEAPSIPPTPRDRPYDGQPHTDAGVRGMEFVEGLTMRDVQDCYRKAILQSTGDVGLNQLAESGTPYEIVQAIYNDVDWKDIDPIVIGQNLTCEIERMMGIFPNVPELEYKHERVEPDNK